MLYKSTRKRSIAWIPDTLTYVVIQEIVTSVLQSSRKVTEKNTTKIKLVMITNDQSKFPAQIYT